MQASVITATIPAERIGAVAQAVNAQIIPAMQRWPDFLGAYWLHDQPGSLMRAVVLSHATGADTKRDERGAVQIQDVAVRAVGGRVTGVEAYDVVAAVGPRVSHAAQFCRSIAWQEDPHQSDQVLQRIESGVIPGVRQNAGFQGGFWLVDRPSGRYAGFTLWDTAAHFEASGAIGRQTRREPMQRGEMRVLGLQQYAILARAEASESAMN